MKKQKMKSVIEWHDIEKDRNCPLSHIFLVADVGGNVYPAIFDWIHESFKKPDYIGWTAITDVKYWAELPVNIKTHIDEFAEQEKVE